MAARTQANNAHNSSIRRLGAGTTQLHAVRASGARRAPFRRVGCHSAPAALRCCRAAAVGCRAAAAAQDYRAAAAAQGCRGATALGFRAAAAALGCCGDAAQGCRAAVVAAGCCAPVARCRHPQAPHPLAAHRPASAASDCGPCPSPPVPRQPPAAHAPRAPHACRAAAANGCGSCPSLPAPRALPGPRALPAAHAPPAARVCRAAASGARGVDCCHRRAGHVQPPPRGGWAWGSATGYGSYPSPPAAHARGEGCRHPGAARARLPAPLLPLPPAPGGWD